MNIILPPEVMKWLGLEHDDLQRPHLHVAFPEKAQSKERPRMNTRNGNVYTPKRTREFEAYVAKHVSNAMRDKPPAEFPLRVDIMLLEAIPKSYKGMKRAAAESGLLFPAVGDVDNKVKALTDAMNGIAYVDDKQIQQLKVKRAYSTGNTIVVRVTRVGLSQYEVDRLAQRYTPGIFGVS